MSQYHNSNLLYRPSVSIWTARKKDKTESVKVNANAGAVDGAANVYKQLLPDSPELLAIQKFQTVFRAFVYDSTLPWDDSGWRIGRVTRHMEFMSEVGDKMAQFDVLVNEFSAAYAVQIENAKFTLNGMFNADDYPGVEEMRSKFSISMDVTTLPNTDDFRVVDGVPQAEVDKLCALAVQSLDAKIAAGMDEAYRRLYSVVNKMATTLAQYEAKEVKKFNDTLLTNIVDVCNVIPALNIKDDARLTTLAQEAIILTGYDIGDLRKDAKTRRFAIKESTDLANKFAGRVQGFVPLAETVGSPVPDVSPPTIDPLVPLDEPEDLNTAPPPAEEIAPVLKDLFADMLGF